MLSFRRAKQTSKNVVDTTFKGTFTQPKKALTQPKKALINHPLRVSRVSKNFCNPTIYYFAVIYL